MYFSNSIDKVMPLELNLQLASPQLFAQSSSFDVCQQRKLGNKMMSCEWIFQPPMMHGVNAELLNRDLWQQFHEQTTEMIITKNGRRMFPSIQVNISGLQKHKNYYVLLEITPVSDHRHKYCGYESGGKMGGWTFAGPAEPQHFFERRIYIHPDSPTIGSNWMANSINFNKLKLTNNTNDNNNNHMILTSMHKYVPKIWIIQCSHTSNYSELFSYPATSFTFKETEFIAVTAYQNENITKLKIDNNPFAKGFRETGQSRFKRKHYPQNDYQSQMDSNCDKRRGSESTSDLESNQVASDGDNVSLAQNLEELDVNSNTDHDETKPLVSAEPTTSTTAENNQVVFHRPWLHSPKKTRPVRRQITLSSYEIPYDLSYLSFYEYINNRHIAWQTRFHEPQFQSYYQSLWWP